MIHRDAPDVVLLDLRMPGLNGIDMLLAAKKSGSQARAIILTSYETDEDIYRAVQAGAQGYLLKDTPLKEMLEAFERCGRANATSHARLLSVLPSA